MLSVDMFSLRSVSAMMLVLSAVVLGLSGYGSVLYLDVERKDLCIAL